MANITLNIEGDLNIYVSEEDGQPDSLYLDGMDGFPETLRIHLEADGEDDESKAEVIYARVMWCWMPITSSAQSSAVMTGRKLRRTSPLRCCSWSPDSMPE